MGLLRRLLGGDAADESRRRRIESSVRQDGEEARAKVKRAEALRKAGLSKEAEELEDKAMMLVKKRSVQMQILASMGATKGSK